MQTLLQALQDAREIVASGPVVMKAIDEKIKGLSTAEALMLLQNIAFRVTRHAPDYNTRRNGRQRATFEFSTIHAVKRGTFI